MSFAPCPKLDVMQIVLSVAHHSTTSSIESSPTLKVLLSQKERGSVEPRNTASVLQCHSRNSDVVGADR